MASAGAWGRGAEPGLIALTGALCGCAGSDTDNAVSIHGDSPIIFVKRSVDALGNPTVGAIMRPGETRTCSGCHSPRRGSAINASPVAGAHPNMLLSVDAGESMAETRPRVDRARMGLKADQRYQHVWTAPDTADTLLWPHPQVDDPAVAEDPDNPTADDVPVLDASDSGCRTLYNWIATGQC